MANRLRLRITGIEELRHAVKAYGNRLVASAIDSVTEATTDTVEQSRALASVKTGKMRDSIKGTVKTDGYSITGTVRVTATADGVPYPALIEFGTSRIAKKPFLVPTAIRNRRILNQKLSASVVHYAPDGLGTPKIIGEGPATPEITIE
jgi:HK97 gp10 family phage protein